MSLLRRRMMMQNNEEKYIVYIYDGFIATAQNTTADDIPAYSSDWPNSVATSSVSVESGDVVILGISGGYEIQKRYRTYNIDKTYRGMGSIFRYVADANGFVRFVAHTGLGGNNIDSLTIVKADGRVIDYEIIDRRGE